MTHHWFYLEQGTIYIFDLVGLFFKQHATVGHATKKCNIVTNTVRIFLTRTELTDM